MNTPHIILFFSRLFSRTTPPPPPTVPEPQTSTLHTPPVGGNPTPTPAPDGAAGPICKCGHGAEYHRGARTIRCIAVGCDCEGWFPPTVPPGGEVGPIMATVSKGGLGPIYRKRWESTGVGRSNVKKRRFRIAGVDGEMTMYWDRIVWYGDDGVHCFNSPAHIGHRAFFSLIREMRDSIREVREREYFNKLFGEEE